MAVDLPNLVMLGAGSMGGAILTGLAEAASGAGGLAATNRTVAKAAAISHPRIESVALEAEPDANQRLVEQAGIVVLGVKPAMILDLARDIGGSLREGALVISIAAGITTERLAAELPSGVAVVRAMPNTPSLVAHGVTGIAAGPGADERALERATSVFEAVGDVLVVPEAQIDALSAISGSGPAYVFLLIEELTAAAERLGFTHEQAKTMAEGTFLGATALLAAERVEPAELRRRVTSPKGTTERALAVLSGAHLDDLFDEAAAAAIERASEIAAG